MPSVKSGSNRRIFRLAGKLYNPLDEDQEEYEKEEDEEDLTEEMLDWKLSLFFFPLKWVCHKIFEPQHFFFNFIWVRD